MADVGSAQIRVELAEEYLRKQIAGIQAQTKAIKDVTITASDGGSFGRLVAGVNEFQRSVAEASQYVQGLSATASQLGQIADALKESTGAAFQAAVGLDSAQTKVSTLTDNTEALTAASRQLADDLKYQSTTTDILNASYDVLSSGFTDVAKVTDIMRASTYAAVGGFTDVETASDALTSVMNAYGQETYEAARVADILIATQDAGKITVAQYGKLIGRVASTAAQAGVSLEELSGFVANATVKGVKASSTIDGLRQAIAAVLKPTKMAAEEAARLGIKFDESALKTGGLKGILDQLNAVGANSNGTLIKLFGSVEAVAAIVPSAGSNIGSLEKQIKTITDSAGKAEGGFNKVSASIEGQLTAASNQGREALASLGQGAVAVILPLAGAAVQLITAFNGLPEPVKAGAGAILTVATGAVAAGAAITGFLAVVPVVTAGWSALGTVFATTTAAQTASTAATVAQGTANTATAATTPALTAGLIQASAAANGLAVSEAAASASTTALGDAISDSVDPVAGKLDDLAESGSKVSQATGAMFTGYTQAGTGATALASGTNTATVATTGLRAGLAGVTAQLATMLAPLALAAAAAIAVKGAWDSLTASLGKGEVASSVNSAAEAIEALDPAITQATESTGPLAEKLGFLGAAFEDMGNRIKENGGIFGAVAASLDGLAEKLNLPVDVFTAKQVDAQQAMIATEQIVEQVGQRLDVGRGILEQYGQASADAGKRQELSSAQIEAFSAKSKEQIDALDATLEALKKIEPADDNHKASLDANIALLSRQKQVLQERTAALGVDTGKLEENSAATQFLTDKIAGLAEAYKAAADASDLATAETQADILDNAVDAGKAAGDVQQAITDAERSGLEKRIAIASEKSNELGRLLSEANGDPAKTKEIQAEIAKIESDIFRDRQALANSVLQERQEAEDKAKQAAEESAREQEKLARESEQASEEAARAAKKAADEQIEAQQKAAEEAKKALQDMVNAADTAYGQQTGKLKNQLDAQLVAIKEQQASGQISKEEAEKAKLLASQESLKAELEQIAQAEQTASQLRAKGAITEEELQQRLIDLESKGLQIRGELADQALAEQDKARDAQEAKAKESASSQVNSAKEGAKGETDEAKKRLEEDKRLRDEQVKAAEDAYNRAVKIAQVSTAEELAAIKRDQASGNITGDEAAALEQAARDKANQAELAQIQKQIAEVNKLKRQGVLTAEEAEAKILDLREARAQAETAIAESQIQADEAAEAKATQAKEQAEQEKAKAAEESAKREQEAQAKVEESKRQQIERTNQARELALAKAKTFELEELAAAYETSKAKGESKEQLDARLAKLEQQGLERAKDFAQDELNSLSSLVEQGVLTEADANRRKEELRQELAQIRISQTQAEDKAEQAAHQAQIARIDERIKLTQAEAQTAIQAREQVKDQLDLEQSNLSSLANLAKARNELDAQRLANNLKDAKTDQEKLTAQQAINAQKVSGLLQEQAFARDQLAIEQQQKSIELEQKAIAAETAVIESQLALEKAKASGASQRELDLLQTQLGLRQQNLASVAKSIAFNDQVLKARDQETLALRQQKDLEATQRQAAEAIQPLLNQPNLATNQINNAQIYGANQPIIPSPINTSSNPFTNTNLSSGPISQIPDIAVQSISNSANNFGQSIDKLVQAMSKQGCSPGNVTVVTKEPVADMMEVLNQLAKR